MSAASHTDPCVDEAQQASADESMLLPARGSCAAGSVPVRERPPSPRQHLLRRRESAVSKPGHRCDGAPTVIGVGLLGEGNLTCLWRWIHPANVKATSRQGQGARCQRPVPSTNRRNSCFWSLIDAGRHRGSPQDVTWSPARGSTRRCAASASRHEARPVRLRRRPGLLAGRRVVELPRIAANLARH